MGTERSTAPGNMDDEARQFVFVLERNGQLADVEEGADTAKLPAKITHVRYPDGRIRRIRFSNPAAHEKSR